MFDFEELKKWIIEHDIEQKAYKGFWMNLENYKIEEPNEFMCYFSAYIGEEDRGDFEVEIKSVSINYSNSYPNCDYNHVIVTIPIRYKGKEVGYYQLLLNFDGTPDDDFFVIH